MLLIVFSAALFNQALKGGIGKSLAEGQNQKSSDLTPKLDTAPSSVIFQLFAILASESGVKPRQPPRTKFLCLRSPGALLSEYLCIIIFSFSPKSQPVPADVCGTERHSRYEVYLA